MTRGLVARFSVAVLGAAALVVGVQTASTADSWNCTSSSNGSACIHEVLGGSPGGSIIWAKYTDTDNAGHYASVQLWATDINWDVGATPSVGDTYVAPGGTLTYYNNFLPLGHGTCHTYKAKVVFRSGTVLWSPGEKYCYNDTK